MPERLFLQLLTILFYLFILFSILPLNPICVAAREDKYLCLEQTYML